MEATFSATMRTKTLDALERKLDSSSLTNHILYILWKSVVTANLRSIERFLAIFSLLAGVWMGWPFGNQYKSNTSVYQTLVEHLPNWAWTIIFLSFSIPALIGCDRTRAVLPSLCVPRYVRIWGAVFALWVWSFLTLVFFLDRSSALAAIWTPVIAFHQLWILLWLWTNENIADINELKGH